MANKVNPENDKLILEAIAKRQIIVYEDGRIFRTRTKRFTGLLDKNGYVTLSVRDTKSQKNKTVFAHRVVYLAFHGSFPPDKQYINHINGIRNDNRLCNLECCDHFDNMQHAWSEGNLHISDYQRSRSSFENTGTRSHASKITEEQVREIREKRRTFNTLYKDLAEEYGMSEASIGQLLRGNTYQDVV